MRNSRPASFLWLAVLLACACLAAHGCQNNLTPAQEVYLARQAYIGTEQAATALIRAGAIPPGPTLDAVVATRDEARATLEEADAKLTSGETLGLDFVIRRLQSALGRLAQYVIEHQSGR